VLLDRRKVKFWQKWVFGLMAVLMAAFLILIPINPAGCGKQTAATDQLQQDITTYKAAVAADPQDAEAWRDLADAYVSDVSARHEQGTEFTAAQTAQLELATKAYRRAARLLAKEKGAEAKAQRLETLEVLAGVYDTMGDYEAEVKVFGQLTELRPRDADYFFGMGNAAINAGDTTSALLAFQRFVDLAPNDSLTPDVKAWIEENAPSSAPTEGTGQ
jgi:tetratricopeptide (TPR) repeat protein